jgi:hypothetical protein
MLFKFSQCDECVYYNNFEINHILNKNYLEYNEIKHTLCKVFNKIHIINKIINYYTFYSKCNKCKIIKLCYKHTRIATKKKNRCDTCYWWGIV